MNADKTESSFLSAFICVHLRPLFSVSPAVLPTHWLTLILLVEPLLQRREVVENRRRIHLLLSGDRLERLRPRTALAHREHRVQPLPGVLVVEDRAAIERLLAAGRLRQAAMKLEL